MNYQEFLSTVTTELAERIEPEVSLKVQSMPRNNGTHYDGLILMLPGRNISPTISLTPYYHRYLDGVNMEDIYTDILCTYYRNLPKQDFDTSLFTCFENVQGRLIMRLVSYSRNEALLENVPYFPFQDLAIIFYYLLYAGEENQACILVQNSHLELWGIDKDMLYQLAQKNTPKLLPSRLTPISELLKRLPSQELAALGSMDIPMYVLTNCYGTNGASALLYEGLLDTVAEELGTSLFILPSSIHEVLLIPASDDSDMELLRQMVCEVNETQLTDEEVLADHAYFYDADTGRLTC